MYIYIYMYIYKYIYAYRTYPRAFLTKYFPSITAHAAVFCLHKNNWGYSKTTNWLTLYIYIYILDLKLLYIIQCYGRIQFQPT